MKTEMKNESIAVGVDIGGTHITTALIDVNTKAVLPDTMIRAIVNADAPADEILTVWFGVIQKVLAINNVPLQRIGFAMPGPFDYEGGVSLIRNMHKYETLYGLNIKELLAEQFGISKDQVKMRNDTEAFLSGEVMCGAAQGYPKAIGITLGTGLGSAKSNHGFTQDVNLGSSLFKDGIAEDYLSTRWFVEKYRECSGETVTGVKELLEMHKNGNPCTPQIFEEFYGNLTLFLQSFIVAEKPNVVVIGGNIAEAYDLFYPSLVKIQTTYTDTVIFKKAKLGEAAALLGAVSNWMDPVIVDNNH
jgi:glucokinase